MYYNTLYFVMYYNTLHFIIYVCCNLFSQSCCFITWFSGIEHCVTVDPTDCYLVSVSNIKTTI